MSDPASVLPEINDVLAAARRLPVCDGAAKLHALIARVMQTAETGGDVSAAVDALETAASAALDDDPWVQFDRAVRRLKSQPDEGLQARPDEGSTALPSLTGELSTAEKVSPGLEEGPAGAPAAAPA